MEEEEEGEEAARCGFLMHKGLVSEKEEPIISHLSFSTRDSLAAFG